MEKSSGLASKIAIFIENLLASLLLFQLAFQPSEATVSGNNVRGPSNGDVRSVRARCPRINLSICRTRLLIFDYAAGTIIPPAPIFCAGRSLAEASVRRRRDDARGESARNLIAAWFSRSDRVPCSGR